MTSPPLRGQRTDDADEFKIREIRCGVVTVAFSRGLLALSSGGVGGGGGGGGVDNAADTATTIESTTMTATMKLLPMPPGLGATEGELERLVRSSLSSCFIKSYSSMRGHRRRHHLLSIQFYTLL